MKDREKLSQSLIEHIEQPKQKGIYTVLKVEEATYYSR